MINILPQPKKLVELGGSTSAVSCFRIVSAEDAAEIKELCKLRFWNKPGICFCSECGDVTIEFIKDLSGVKSDKPELLKEQGYCLDVTEAGVKIRYEGRAGLINAITTLKLLIVDGKLPCCQIVDWPSLSVRAIAQTFSWYAGYGRFGFDSQLWGYEEWVEYLNICLDNKINQFNLVMYGYWPFDLPGHPETVFRDVPIKIWNAENRRWLTVRYTHPNLEEPFMDRFIQLAHKFCVKIFAYVGLNSYNGAYSIKHPEARMKPPAHQGFLNDFDSLCLSYPGVHDYIVESMEQIARLGFDGYTLEESEEGFWFCECDACKERWHAISSTPGEAKHKANMWLLNDIWNAVKAINPDAVIGIRAYRQPPLEKDPAFLAECVETLPKGIKLFWAPGLYVPEGEFDKWCEAFGKENIWGRDTEANSITSTMGRLYRTFQSNMLRYEDEANEQTIETDIRQHRGSVERGVHGINGFMFEWYGLPMHLFAHGNFGWGSTMENDDFYHKAVQLNFGELGEDVLWVMQNMLTIHESQLGLYTTPFPFQKNKVQAQDIPTIEAAIERHPAMLEKIHMLQDKAYHDPVLRPWLPHFDRWENAERRNRIIYDMALAGLRYDAEEDPVKKDAILDEILYFNERDFDIAKEMFFDINPVGETGVKSCMFPYHEMKRLIHNIRHPENPDDAIICSGVEALGWLWL